MRPAGPMQAYKTYGMAMPLRTHWRKATCEEVDCQPYRHGWACTVTADTRAEADIRNSGRYFLLPEMLEGGFIKFVFPSGQPCFRATSHRIQLERPALYVVRGGDGRGSTGVIRKHVSGDDWVDDFRNHQDKIADAVGRG